jgi:radical SAM protein with 4Fe4S-binding SPASM domain
MTLNEILINEDLYVLNPDYIIKHDDKRSFIIARSEVQCENSTNNWLTIIHPAQAMILSFFSSPDTLKNTINKLCVFLELSEEEVTKMIANFIDNPTILGNNFNGNFFNFPPNIIIKHKDHLNIVHKYLPEEFMYKQLDFETARLIKSPAVISLMVTNKCVTKCVYCYADKRNEISCQISFEKYKEIIKEAKSLKVKDIQVAGGEFFLYDKWHELLSELKENGYENNFISTKMPITESDIIKLKEFPRLTFQFSFDSLKKEKLTQLLGVSGNYLENMKTTLRNMDKYKLPYNVISVLTNINIDKTELTDMYNFLCTLKYITHWDTRIAYRSLYSTIDFDKIKLNQEEAVDIYTFLNEFNNYKKLKVRTDNSNFEKGFYKAENGSKSFQGASCSANKTHIFILPDGNVTICEQMYWKKRFIIGNILNNGIEEVWNSPEALKWVNMTPTDFREDSACKKCEILDDCYNKNPNKCWADTLKVYGDENWDYPDPRCNKAPKMIYDLM